MYVEGSIEMDSQYVFNIIMSLAGVMGGWVLKTIWDSIRDLKDEIRSLSFEVHQDFARRDDFKEAIKEVKDMLVRIFDKLDDKADKSNP
tara:strand:- start:942 stop:1208 length:267 start_codon:yes stop_codon:yes gene_type:complete